MWLMQVEKSECLFLEVSKLVLWASWEMWSGGKKSEKREWNLKENHQTPRDIRMSDNATLVPPASNQGPTTPRKGPPKFKQRQTRQFKSKPPKKGVKGFGDDIPGMEGLGTDITVICPWEAFSHLELHELAQFGII
ncbi:retinal cone rhodopsin-sensitive cGMP 3',5'-cyclic phosphodiesterase subunit gamma isoform X1 [Halichoerus grypus]